MFMLKLIDALKCRGIDDKVLSYNSREVEIQFEYEVYSENEISVGEYFKDKADVRVDLKCRLRHW